MPDTPTRSILKKMSSPKPGTGLPVARQLHRALETAADKRFGLAVEVRGVHQSLRPLEDVRGLLEERGFLALLEGRPAAGFGLDMAVLSGLVEHQTIGNVLSRSEILRAPTRVDAALLAPLLDECLGRFGASLAEDGHCHWGRGYGFGAMVGTARALVLALSEGLYHVFEMDIALGGGAREGRIVFAFPDKVDAAVPDPVTEGPKHPPEETLRSGVLTAQATLDAVLVRISMPLSQLQGLSAGDVLALPRGALKDARLEMGGGAHGLAVTLGQLHGFRAVRLKAGQEKSRDLAVDGSAPSLREALNEEPDMAKAEVAAMPLDTAEIESKAPFEGDAIEDVADVEEGLDDLDDLLGGIDGENAARDVLLA